MLASWSRRDSGCPAGGVCACVAATEKARGLGAVCRLGSSIASRPVAEAVWQKLPRMRTSLHACHEVGEDPVSDQGL